MSYVFAGALQTAVFQKLASDQALKALIGDAVYDELPAGKLPSLFVALGPESVRDRSDATGAGAEHRFEVAVVTDQAGFQAAKTAAGAVSDALLDGDLSLSKGRLVGVWFLSAVARRSGKAGRLRRIDLRFRARVEDN